jgi:hypothetical protein
MVVLPLCCYVSQNCLPIQCSKIAFIQGPTCTSFVHSSPHPCPLPIRHEKHWHFHASQPSLHPLLTDTHPSCLTPVLVYVLFDAMVGVLSFWIGSLLALMLLRTVVARRVESPGLIAGD